VSAALAHEFTRASGDRASDCAAIVQRYPEADGCYRPGRGESFVCVVRDGRMRLEIGGACWFTGLWRGPDRTLYVSDCAGQVHWLPRGEGTRWQSAQLPGALLGLWGLDDRAVWCWGTRGDAGVLYRFDGEAWGEVASPGVVVAMHGVDPSLVVAVGRGGLVARWDGAAWSAMRSPVTETLHGVCVRSEDAMYAVGTEGAFLEGSAWGWALRERRDHLLYSVGSFRDAVYVGAPFPDGLLALTPAGLATVHRELDPYQFDARADLLLANPYLLASTDDGERWLRLEVADAARLLAAVPFTPSMR